MPDVVMISGILLEIGLPGLDDIIGFLDVMRSIDVGHQQAVVPCLIPDGEQVGIVPDQVGDACILEAVEFPLVRESQSFPDIVAPVVGELLRRVPFRAWPELVAEEIVRVRMSEDLQVNHELYHHIRESHRPILPIFRAVVRDEYGASLDGYVLELDVGHLIGPDEAVVQDVACQQEVPILLQTEFLQPEHGLLRYY